MSIEQYAKKSPDKKAVVMERENASVSFGQLNNNSSLIASLLRKDLAEGDRIALLLENSTEYFELSWAARRAGLRWVPVNWHLRAEEVAYMVDNSDSRILIASPSLAEIAREVRCRADSVEYCYSAGQEFDQFPAIGDAIKSLGETEIDSKSEGMFMFYSSGTTGQPKGILRPLRGVPFGTHLPIEKLMPGLFGFDESTVFYTPSPLYHAAPLGWTMGTQQLGGTVVCSGRFDAEQALAAIEKYGVTHALFVPTHLARMLKLPQEVKNKYDYSSLKRVIHSAAPCPPEVKRGMIDWWGPIIHEFYGSSEGAGFTAISSEEWLDHPGSVGRSMSGKPHILDDAGNELPIGQIGQLCFEGVERFEYHKSPEKTEEFFDNRGWAHTGDLARVDEDDYIYLAGRSSGMIISGGVNIYPQEVENVLTLHPLVVDVAVLGVPDQDLGESAQAVIQLATHRGNVDAITEQLKAYCLENLAKYKCPRSFRYVDHLPRLPNGKLLRRYIE